MITRCTIAPMAAARLVEYAGLPHGTSVQSVELEFREVPYFIVSRSRERWGPERGDINMIRLVGMNDKGLLADPDNREKPTRWTLIPWSNVISLTVEAA